MNTPGEASAPTPHSGPSSSRHPSHSGGAVPQDRDRHGHDPGPTPGSYDDPQFDLVNWHPMYQSCQRYFVNHAQHGGLVQAVAAFVNIRLPFQWRTNPVTNMPQVVLPISGSAPSFQEAAGPSQAQYPVATSFGQRQMISNPPLPFVSLVPYLRRLIVTGFDTEAIMFGFFGNDWVRGVGPLHEVERRNYLFAAKSVGWAKVKYQYDAVNGQGDETVPFMKPLQRVQIGEIERGERAWSEWLCMEDWMVGPHAPPPDMDVEEPEDHFQQPSITASTAAHEIVASPRAQVFGIPATTAEESARRAGPTAGDESMQS